MKKVILTLVVLFTCFSVYSQEKESVKIYHDNADARQQIIEATKKASKENKHVFLMLGGNWCKWCRMFEAFRTADNTVDSLFTANFVVEHINFSKENKNNEVMKTLDFPQRFGFPVFVILDATGKRLHTQRTDYLEEGQGYSASKVAQFLQQWSPAALTPDQYQK